MPFYYNSVYVYLQLCIDIVEMYGRTIDIQYWCHWRPQSLYQDFSCTQLKISGSCDEFDTGFPAQSTGNAMVLIKCLAGINSYFMKLILVENRLLITKILLYGSKWSKTLNMQYIICIAEIWEKPTLLCDVQFYIFSTYQ